MRFDSTPLDPALVKALADKGFHTAFPIQELTLEMGIRGQDIIGQARTGTGKTLGFGLPVLHRIDPDKDHIQALIVAPTRELTAQVAEDLQIGAARGIHVTAVYGGVPIDPQFDELKKAHVVVGTPGRLLDHLNRGTMDLSRVTELVLDEADEMLDMGFLPDVERLMSACPPSAERHTSLFSATMAPAIVSLARRYMDSPSFLHAKSDEPQTAELVEQHFFLVHRMDKPRLLARIMQQPGREGCYVFSRTKAMCDRLVTELEDLGVAAIAIHGDLRQSTREKNLDKFREGKASILVATEVAARGLDVDNVTHVVNYDCPDDDKMYLHRIGRTARAGRSGVAVTFAEHNEIEKLNVIRKAVGAYEGDLPQMFSTSPELQEIFDLPDETPWDHLAKRGSSKGGSSRSSSSKGGSSKGDSSRGGSSKGGSSRGGSSRGDDRDDRGGRDRSHDDRGSSRGKERDNGRAKDRDTDSRKVEARDEAPARGRDDRDDAPTRKPRDRARGRDDARTESRGDRAEARERTSNRDGDGGRGEARTSFDDQPRTRTRTRTRVRSTEGEARDGGRDNGRTRDRDDRDDRGNGRDRDNGRARDRDDRDRGRDRDDRDRSRERSDRDRDDDQPQARPRARRRARGGRGRGGGGASEDRGSSRGDDRDRGRSSEQGRSRQSEGRDRDDRSRDDDRNRDDRGRDGRSGSNRSSSRSGARSSSRSSNRSNDDRSGGRSNSSRSSSRSGGRSNSTRSSSSSQRQAPQTTAERRTRRGEDARGEGQPRLSRRVEVENLP